MIHYIATFYGALIKRGIFEYLKNDDVGYQFMSAQKIQYLQVKIVNPHREVALISSKL
jgi:hypothetical protein